jgi:ABC-2 type transport system ATP-binding protein
MRLDSVRIRYGRRAAWVLDGITVDLAAGTVTSVTGGNGSGKSTLLKVTCGLTRPTSGVVGDRPDRVGYVPERLPADMRMTARTYLQHMGRIQGIGSATAARRGGALLDELHLEGGIDSPISTLSKGNAQKVALAQALLAEPQLLVLDEPWSGLDADTHQILTKCLARQRESGAIILLAEHREAAVEASADVVYRLAGGKLTEEKRVEPRQDGRAGSVAITLGAKAEMKDSNAGEALKKLPGVRAARWADSRVHLEVAAAKSDAVLMEALRAGFTVYEVRVTEAAAEALGCGE